MRTKNVNPKAVGERSEAIILAALIQQGYVVSIPFGDNQRYDLLVDDGERILRVQCKTAYLCRGTIRFDCCNNRYMNEQGNAQRKRSYKGEVDVFFVYSPDTKRVYRIDIQETGSTVMSLRVDPLKKSHCLTKWAKDFEFA